MAIENGTTWPEQQLVQLVKSPSGVEVLATQPTLAVLADDKALDVRGIYAIVNCATGKAYIGSSERVLQRIRQHFSALRKGKHVNIKLSRAWQKYPRQSWTWSLLEEVRGSSIDDLLGREQYWIDQLGTAHSGYNIAVKADSPMKGRKHTAESKRLCALASAKLDRRNPEYRKKLSEARSGPRNPMFGREVSPETRLKLAKAHRGKKHTPETLNKMSATARVTQKGARNGFYGKSHTPETRQRLIETLEIHRAKSIEANKKRKGKSWADIYDPETIARMREALVASNKRRSHGSRS